MSARAVAFILDGSFVGLAFCFVPLCRSRQSAYGDKDKIGYNFHWLRVPCAAGRRMHAGFVMQRVGRRVARKEEVEEEVVEWAVARFTSRVLLCRRLCVRDYGYHDCVMRA